LKWDCKTGDLWSKGRWRDCRTWEFHFQTWREVDDPEKETGVDLRAHPNFDCVFKPSGFGKRLMRGTTVVSTVQNRITF
jgi:hypothetical protein